MSEIHENFRNFFFRQYVGIHRFLTDIWEKNFHGSLVLLQNTKNILFGKYPYSDGILFKKDFENKLKENFCKNTSKKNIFFFY